MENKYNTLLYYQFCDIANPELFAKEHKKLCDSLGLKGRILVATEGLNGSVSGTQEQTDAYISAVMQDERFRNMDFKVEQGASIPFTKMRVLVKNETIAMHEKIDIANAAPYTTADELKEIYEADEDIIVLDTRNDYEWKVGKFKNAVTMPIKTFREFPQKVLEMFGDKKDKKIVTYCTGGIRCEKATAFMREQGFTNVTQLHNGIITYIQKHPNTHWEGKCFVFDKRLMSDVGQTGKDEMNACAACGGDCDLLRNCRNVACDKYVTLCNECQVKLNGNCSQACFEEFRANCRAKALAKQGRKKSAHVPC